MNHTLWSLSDYFFAFIFRVGNSLIFLNGGKKKKNRRLVLQKSSQGGQHKEEREVCLLFSIRQLKPAFDQME